MIKNIFLDAGGVILDESKFEKCMETIIIEKIQTFNKKYSIIDYQNDIDEAVHRYVPKVYDYILFKYIRDIDKFNILKENYKMEITKKLNDSFLLLDGIKEFLIQYSEIYKIGILGQYGKSFLDFLKQKDLIKHFAYCKIQDNYNITKPDPRYFEAILEKCNCKADESIMVGDRIDKDIIPAKMIGMKTIRLRTGIHENQEPRTPDEIPDITVNSIKEIEIENINNRTTAHNKW